MKTLFYAGQTIAVAGDLADEIMRAATEFANEGKCIQVPVACYVGDAATTASFVVGAGIPVMFIDPAVPDLRPDPPRTLESWAWIRDEVDALQSDQ